jgi:hypothetical protein
MTPSREKRVEVLWQRLIGAHRAQTEIEPRAGWQAGVLQALRRLPAPVPPGKDSGSIFLGELVWRAAAAAGVAAVLAAAYLLAQPSGMDLLTSLLVEDPAEGVIELALNR